MKNINRRNFLKTTAATGAALMAFGGSAYAQNKSKSAKILILGGGFGGSTAAKYLKLLKPDLDITLVDRKDAHVSCVMSNEVIFGLSPDSKIILDHSVLNKKYGIKFIKGEVLSFDAKTKTVKTSQGDLKYDILIVSPGIGYLYEPEKGYTEEVQKLFPAAWVAGDQTFQLKKQVDGMKKGDTVIIRTPKALYRCPPGPYERSCLMAERAKKVGAKVIVLDPNKGIVSKAPLFTEAFGTLYKDTLTYIPEVELVKFDAKNRTISTNKGDFKGDIINYIPNQRAADMVFNLKLNTEGVNWAPINPQTFESVLFKDVYVIGDAIYSEPITVQPKSGVVANNMAQTLANNIVNKLEGKEWRDPFFGNSCYSMVSSEQAIWIATIYWYNPETKKIEIKDGANAIPKAASVENKHNLESWADNFIQDCFK